MAANYKYTGNRIKVVAADVRGSGEIVSDLLTAGGGQVAGICLAAVAASETYTIAVAGVFNVVVPAETSAGTLVYAPGSTGGPDAGVVVLTVDDITPVDDDPDVLPDITNTLFGKTLTDIDASGKADVLIFEPRY